MTTLYKLTDQAGYTRKGKANGCLWGNGVSHSGTGEGDLCGPGYIHAYTDPLLALLLNPIHASIKNPRLWVCEGEIAKSDRGLKVGCVELTAVSEIPVPAVTEEHRIRFGILCALEVYDDKEFASWARSWLDDKDRTAIAAHAAAGGYLPAWVR